MKLPIIDDSNSFRTDGGAPTRAQRRRLEMDELREFIAIFEQERKRTEDNPLRDYSITAVVECKERLRQLCAEEAADSDVCEEQAEKY